MTTYYTPSGNPLTLTRGASGLIRSEFVLIQTGFTSATSDMNAVIASVALKGAISGQTWTGAHNFSGATVTLPVQAYDFSGAQILVPTATAGDSSTKAASTAFCAALALSAALPAQTRQAGNIVTTDGTNGSFKSLIEFPEHWM